MSPFNIDALKTKDGFRFAPITFIQGAIECGHTAHLQTSHGIVAIRPYNIKEIRINKRTGEQYFPGEAVGQNWLIEFYPPGHKHGDEIQLYTSSAAEASRFIHFHLNGMDRVQEEAYDQHQCLFPVRHVYDTMRVWCNQAKRDATIIAKIDDQVLLEVEMPGTTSKWAGHPAQPTSFLAQYTVSGRELINKRNVSYNAVPKRWLAAIREAGTTDWIGMGQRSTVRIPFPVEVQS